MPFIKGDPNINREGRPKGKTMKEFAREYLMAQTNEEKIAFLNSLSKDTVWRMAEGNPANDMEIKGNVNHIFYLPTQLLEKHDLPQLPEPDSE